MKEKFHWDSTDIADAVINHSFPSKHSLKQAYTLSDDQFIDFHGKHFMRNYNEAGLTAHNYHWEATSSVTSSLYRYFVSTLSSMRDKLFAYDKEHAISAQQKEQTLIVEWSGANDLLIANTEPSKAAVNKAIQARIENIEHLIQQGYRQFVLFNLPDLFFTPSYQRRSAGELDNAHQCSVYFNTKLAEACQTLAYRHPEYSIEEFDVNQIFTQGYNSPEKYGLDKQKLSIPYLVAEVFFNKIRHKLSLIKRRRGP